MKNPNKFVNICIICLVMLFSISKTTFAGYSGESNTISNVICIYAVGSANAVSFELDGDSMIYTASDSMSVVASGSNAKSWIASGSDAESTILKNCESIFDN